MKPNSYTCFGEKQFTQLCTFQIEDRLESIVIKHHMNYGIAGQQ